MSGGLGSELAELGEMVERLAAFDRATSVDGADVRWRELDPQTEGQIDGRRALVVGAQVRDDAAAFAARGASYVLACASAPGIERPDSSAARTGVELLQLSWEELHPVRYGTFELVHCNGLLHRVTEPLRLLRTLRSLTAPGGTLLIGSMMLSDPERSEYLRFFPDRYAADPTWWFVPGRLAFRWLVETAGFEVVAEFGEREGPRDLVPVAAGYLKAIARR
jgi:SAM-dependent methyltransferase